MPEPPPPGDPWSPPPPAEAGDGVGPAAPGSARPADKVSIAAFVVSLVGAGIVAIPLAIWGLVRTKASSRRGRGFAVAALAISVAWTALASVLLLTSGVLGGAKPASPDALASIPVTTPSAPSTTTSATPSSTHVAVQPTGPLKKPKRVYWESLKPTMCFRLPADQSSVYVTVVDCRTGHDEEVSARTVLAGPRKWPGGSAIDAAAEARCRVAFQRYVGIAFDDSRLELDFFTGDRAAWQAGDHRLICLVLDPSVARSSQALRGAAE
jgi:hypothetical protein